MGKDNFKKEKEFLKDLQNIKRKRKENEENLYVKLMSVIDNAVGNDKKKQMLKTLINNLDKDIENMNPMTFVMEVNILISKLLFIAKSKVNSVPSELLVPYLSIKEDPEVWLANMKDGIVPYLVNGELFDIINIKGLNDA